MHAALLKSLEVFKDHAFLLRLKGKLEESAEVVDKALAHSKSRMKSFRYAGSDRKAMKRLQGKLSAAAKGAAGAGRRR